MPKEMLRMSQFQGINVDVDETLLSASELVKAENTEIIDGGKLAKTQGTEFVNSVSLSGKIIQTFEWARDDGTVLRFGRLYKEVGGFGSVSLVRIMDDGTTQTIYEKSVEIKSNFVATFTAGESLTLNSGLNDCRGLYYDGEYLFVGLHLSNATIDIVKINVATMDAVGTAIINEIDEGNISYGTTPTIKMTSDGTYLYVVIANGSYVPLIREHHYNAVLYKFNISTMSQVSKLAPSEYGVFRFDSNPGLFTLDYIDGYLWLFTAKIYKIDITTFTITKSSEYLYERDGHNDGPFYFSSAKYDDDYFYITLNTSPAQIYKVNRESLEIERTLTLFSGYNGCYASAFIPEGGDGNGPYMFVGTNTAPAKIVKINLDSMEVVNYTSLDSGVNYCRDLVYDGTNNALYAAMATSPGKIVAIDPSTLKVMGTLTLSSGQDSCNALLLIDSKLYIGLGTSPSQILEYSVTITYDSTYEEIDAEKKRSGTFSLKDILYLLTEENYLQYDGSAVTEVAEETEDDQGAEVTDCDLDPIRGCTMGLWHPTSFRCFFAGDGSNKLYYSERNDPRWVKKAGYVVPSTGDGPIKGLALSMDSVVVFFQRSAWVWGGQDPSSDATWKRLPLTEGTESPATIENGTNQMEWLGTGSGYWAMAPAMIGATTVINPSQSLLANLAEKKVTNYLKDIKNRELACSAYDTRERKCYIAYCDDASLDYCNKMLIRNTDIPGSFTLLTGQQIYDLLYTSSGELWIATENYIVKRHDHYKQALTDGTYGAIAMDIRTPASILGNPYREKQVHSLSVGFMNPGAGFELNVKLYVDDVAVFEETYVTINGEGNYIMARFTDIYDAIGTRFAVEITNSQAATKAVIYEVALQYSLASNYGQSI